MTVIFDGSNKLILPDDTSGSLNIKYVYSEWKRWSINNSNFLRAFSTVGGDPISSDNNIPTYFYLMNGWRIKWKDGNISVEIQGNLLVHGGLDVPYLPIKNGYSYNLTSVVATQDALSAERLHEMLDSYMNKDAFKTNKDDIANAVWNDESRTLTSTESMDEDQLHTALDNYQNKDDFKTIVESKEDIAAAVWNKDI